VLFSTPLGKGESDAFESAIKEQFTSAATGIGKSKSASFGSSSISLQGGERLSLSLLSPGQVLGGAVMSLSAVKVLSMTPSSDQLSVDVRFSLQLVYSNVPLQATIDDTVQQVRV
jgi:hypothetical protein